MIISFMKQNTLEQAKATLPDVYRNYFTQDTNEWMREVWGADVFIPYKEVPDFELAPLRSGLRPGEIDQRNCEILSTALPLTPSEAADERLWAGITNGVFYNYMRGRFGYSKEKEPSDKDEKEILSRFFFASHKRSGIYRNALAKCWWVGHLLYDAGAADPFDRLKKLGNLDFATAVNDIFYNYSFSASRSIMDGVLLAMEECRARGISMFSPKQYLRHGLQHLNAMGAGIVLDVLEPNDICAIVMRGIADAAENEGQDRLRTIFESVPSWE